MIGNPEEERRAEFYQQPWAQEAVGRHIFAKVRNRVGLATDQLAGPGPSFLLFSRPSGESQNMGVQLLSTLPAAASSVRVIRSQELPAASTVLGGDCFGMEPARGGVGPQC